jgi:hypothetical protein
LNLWALSHQRHASGRIVTFGPPVEPAPLITAVSAMPSGIVWRNQAPTRHQMLGPMFRSVREAVDDLLHIFGAALGALTARRFGEPFGHRDTPV